jgi:hypothetical protein
MGGTELPQLAKTSKDAAKIEGFSIFIILELYK